LSFLARSGVIRAFERVAVAVGFTAEDNSLIGCERISNMVQMRDEDITCPRRGRRGISEQCYRFIGCYWWATAHPCLALPLHLTTS